MNEPHILFPVCSAGVVAALIAFARRLTIRRSRVQRCPRQLAVTAVLLALVTFGSLRPATLIVQKAG